MLKTSLKLFCIAVLMIVKPSWADDSFTCGQYTFIIEKGLFSGKVTQVKASDEKPFCVSDNPTILTKRLSFRDQEVWCVTSHHLSTHSRPLAKQIWVLNRSSKKLYHYDYLFLNGHWALQDERQDKCNISSEK